MVLRRFVPLLFTALTLFACGGNDSTPDDGSLTQAHIDEIKNNPQQVLMYIDNVARQCGFDGYAPDETAQTLQDNDINVVRSGCGNLTDLFIVALCGAGDTRINLHIINSTDESRATELGFSNVSGLATENGPGFELVACR